MSTPPDPYWSALRTELDDIAQSLFGIIAALVSHQRRAHRSKSRAYHELVPLVQQLTALQGRLAHAVHSRDIS